MSGQPGNSSERYWFFNNIKKIVKYNKQFITVTGNVVSCTVCREHLPVSVVKTESSEKEFSLFTQHISGEVHLENVLNYIVSMSCPRTSEVSKEFKLSKKKHVLLCMVCNTSVNEIRDIGKTIKNLKFHVCGKKHQQKLQNVQGLPSIHQKKIETKTIDFDAQDQSKASANATTSVPSSSTTLCSVCETQIEIFNQDILLSRDLHKQSEQHSSTCKRKLKTVIDKYEEGNHKNLLTELFDIYPELIGQLEHCELFTGDRYYFVCSVCGECMWCLFGSVNDEIHKHLSSSKVCESTYLSQIFDEFLSNKDSASEGKEANKPCTDEISDLFDCLPPHLQLNKCVISSVGSSLYCTMCSCYIMVCVDKLQSIQNLTVHLETIHFENLLNKVFDQISEKFQNNKQFMLYNGNFIKCTLCNIGITYSPVKIKQTTACINEHLKGRQHQKNLKQSLPVTEPNKPLSVDVSPLPETANTFEGNIDKLIGFLLPDYQELATLLKKNSKFLQVYNMDFECTLCEEKIGSVQKIKDACSSIVMHFRSEKHVSLTHSTSQNVSLWKLVYDCYMPDLIKSNEMNLQEVGDKIRCTLCSFHINGQKVENVVDHLLGHVTSNHL